MAGPWLYTISADADAYFNVPGNPPIKVTVDSFRELVENEKISDDEWGVSQLLNQVEVEDEIFIYSKDKNVGIIGWARVRDIDFDARHLTLNFNLEKTLKLLAKPISADKVREWKLMLRRNLINLAPVEKKLRTLLPKGFATPRQIHINEKDLTDAEIDQRLRDGWHLIENVATGDPMALVPQRRGQARLRQLMLSHYKKCCAVCDVSDINLLVASHIVGWAKSRQIRGDLRNVICLCRMHDALFEAGYWSLDNDLQLLRKENVQSKTISRLLDEIKNFRKPDNCSPHPNFLKKHRKNAGFE